MPDTSTLLIIFPILVFAGLIKGIVGLGLPLVAISLLVFFMPLPDAVAVMVIPAFMMNLWQFIAGREALASARRFFSLALALLLTTFIGVQFVSAGVLPQFVLGLVLASYGMIGLFLPKLSLPPQHERWLSPVIGACTGLFNGATGVASVPLVPYLTMLNLSKDTLIQGMGFIYLLASLGLGLGLGQTGIFGGKAILGSAIALIPGLIGMWIGQRIRGRMNQTLFRRCFLVAIILLGLGMVAKVSSTLFSIAAP